MSSVTNTYMLLQERPADNDRYVKNCKNGRSPKETRWWFHDDKAWCNDQEKPFIVIWWWWHLKCRILTHLNVFNLLSPIFFNFYLWNVKLTLPNNSKRREEHCRNLKSINTFWFLTIPGMRDVQFGNPFWNRTIKSKSYTQTRTKLKRKFYRV